MFCYLLCVNAPFWQCSVIKRKSFIRVTELYNLVTIYRFITTIKNSVAFELYRLIDRRWSTNLSASVCG
jgi:hypothetical protein